MCFSSFQVSVLCCVYVFCFCFRSVSCVQNIASDTGLSNPFLIAYSIFSKVYLKRTHLGQLAAKYKLFVTCIDDVGMLHKMSLDYMYTVNDEILQILRAKGKKKC